MKDSKTSTSRGLLLIATLVASTMIGGAAGHTPEYVVASECHTHGNGDLDTAACSFVCGHDTVSVVVSDGDSNLEIKHAFANCKDVSRYTYDPHQDGIAFCNGWESCSGSRTNPYTNDGKCEAKAKDHWFNNGWSLTCYTSGNEIACDSQEAAQSRGFGGGYDNLCASLFQPIYLPSVEALDSQVPSLPAGVPPDANVAHIFSLGGGLFAGYVCQAGVCNSVPVDIHLDNDEAIISI